MTTFPPSYWDDPRHWGWQRHYSPGKSGFLLSFSPWWRNRNLPPDGESSLRHDLKDTRSGKVYEGLPFWVATDYNPSEFILDSDGSPVSHMSLQDYMCSSHHCGCHRADAISDKYPDFDDGGTGCDELGPVLRIVKVYAEAMPDLVLYSETMSAEELEAGLVPAEAS